MNEFERKQWIEQLWNKVRIMVFQRRRHRNGHYDMENC